jgi:hypothetical protein
MTTYKPAKILMLLLICLGLSGCYKEISGTIRSSHDDAGKAHSFAKIELLSEEELKKHLKTKISEDKKEIIEKINSSIQRNIEYLEKQQINLLKMSQLLGSASGATGTYGNSWQEKLRFYNDRNQLEQAVSKSFDASNEWVKQIEATKKSIKDDQLKIENLKNGKDGAYYFSDQIGKEIEKADGEGKFKIRYFSSGNRYLLIRSVNKFWCLKLTDNQSELYLSDLDVVDLNSSKNSCPNIKKLLE